MDGSQLAATGVSEEEHEALLEFLYLCPHGLAEFDTDGALRMVNPACARMLTPILPAGSGLENLIDALAPFAPDLRAQLGASAGKRGLVLDGLRIHVGLSPRRRASRGGAAPDPLVLALTVLRLSSDRHMAVVADVSTQVAQERRVREAEAWFAAVAEGAEDYAFFSLDADGHVVDWNASAERLFGLDEAQTLGRSAQELLPGEKSNAALADRLARARRDGWHLAEGWMQRASGARFWGTSVVSVMQAAEAGAEATPLPQAYLLVTRDRTERRNAAEELQRALCRDHLTGLLNRRRFFELGAEECAAALHSGRALSVAMVDADRFKSINDHFGHAAGDAVLCALADALRASVREGVDQVARLGGEEFAVLMPGLDVAAAMIAAEQLRVAIASLRVPVRELNSTSGAIEFTASFGVAEIRPDVADLESLLRVADQALYAAKAAGRNRVCSEPADVLIA